MVIYSVPLHLNYFEHILNIAVVVHSEFLFYEDVSQNKINLEKKNYAIYLQTCINYHQSHSFIKLKNVCEIMHCMWSDGLAYGKLDCILHIQPFKSRNRSIPEFTVA